jgi:hypothetical protein
MTRKFVTNPKCALRFVLLLCSALSWSSSGWAHDLTVDQLLLSPDLGHGRLRGQLTFNPHATRGGAARAPAELRERVKAMVRAQIRIELDGKPCEPKLEVRELWVPAGATLGDVVLLECPLAPANRELTLAVGGAISALVVSVQTIASDGSPETRSTLVEGGGTSPPFRFGSKADWQEGGANQFELAASERARRHERSSPWPQALAYLRLGFRHIVPGGWDHVLFVSGLFFGARRRWRRLLLELSAFTLAHATTLALGALGLVVLPRSFVEPAIAFSIALVGFENLRGRSPRARLALVFAFGLLHGQGFAAALSDLGLPENSFLAALLAFNGGVELGQLAVVMALALGTFRLSPSQFERWMLRRGSLLIGLAGLVWGVWRLLG